MTPRFWHVQLLSLFLVPACVDLRAQVLPIRTYATADGLAHNTVNRIVRDSRGFLWFCTAGGLSRFDGYTFTNFGTEQGLPVSSVNDLLETRTGAYWVAGDTGTILHYNGTTWSSASSGTTLYLTGVWGSSASDVWAVGDRGTILHGAPTG